MQRTATLIRNQAFMLALAAFVALGALLGTGQRAGADTFFDYLDDTGNSNFLFLPRLHNGNVAAVDAALAAQQGNGELLRLKSNHVLSDPTALALFDNYDVDYVFGDYEFLLAPTNLSTLAGQVGASTMSSDAFVGNFNIYPVFPDPTRPLPTTGSVSAAGYLLSGATMANEALYPGSVSFRGPTSGNSSAPNIIFGNLRAADRANEHGEPEPRRHRPQSQAHSLRDPLQQLHEQRHGQRRSSRPSLRLRHLRGGHQRRVGSRSVAEPR